MTSQDLNLVSFQHMISGQKIEKRPFSLLDMTPNLLTVPSMLFMSPPPSGSPGSLHASPPLRPPRTGPNQKNPQSPHVLPTQGLMKILEGRLLFEFKLTYIPSVTTRCENFKQRNFKSIQHQVIIRRLHLLYLQWEEIVLCIPLFSEKILKKNQRLHKKI